MAGHFRLSNNDIELIDGITIKLDLTIGPSVRSGVETDYRKLVDDRYEKAVEAWTSFQKHPDTKELPHSDPAHARALADLAEAKKLRDKALGKPIQRIRNLKAGPIDGFPDSGASGSDPGGDIVRLQFPARLTSDSKSARWINWYNTYLYEPGFYYKGGDTRKATLSITYVVGGPVSGSGGEWTPIAVANEVRRLKSYFYVGGKVHKFLPVYKIILYENIPSGEGGPGKAGAAGNSPKVSAWRGTQINIKHGDELVTYQDETYPLKTEVNLNIEMTSKIVNVKGAGGQGLVKFQNLPDKPQKVWY